MFHRTARPLLLLPCLALAWSGAVRAEVPAPPPDVSARVAAVAPQVREWRRDIHSHPELANEERRTAALVAAHLRRLGFDEVRTGVGRTGVVGLLRGARPGATLALRADMDALPIREATGLPFASQATGLFDGHEVPVMHGCGHDAHTAMLMGAASVLAGMRDRISGTIMFIFQPAEEGGPPDMVSGARAMIADGLFAHEKPSAIMALHVEPGPAGQIQVRSGSFLAGSTDLSIDLSGRQTHAGRPWEGTDLINLSADIVKSLTTISARRLDLVAYPNVISVGSLQAGLRKNILPGTAEMRGTIRTFDQDQQASIQTLIRTSIDGLAQSYGAQARVSFTDSTPVTRNDPKLLDSLMPALRAAAGAAGVDANSRLRGAAEDFSFLEQEIPGLYYILGSTPAGIDPAQAPTNHSDRFDIDESVLPVGVTAHVLTALAFLDAHAP